MNSKANFRAAALARTLAIGLVAAPLAAVPSQPAIAQAVQNANGSLQLSVGRGRLVSLPATMSDVFVANAVAADVQARAGRPPSVLCHNPGARPDNRGVGEDGG